MRIAQVSPLYESVPPKLYGGTERIVSYLTEELVRQGHEVTLFASGDSVTSAELVPFCDMALRLNPSVTDPLPHHLMMLDEVRRRADHFDVIHFHTDLLHMPLVRDFAGRTVTTLHGRLDLVELPAFYRTFSDAPLVSISDDQRRPLAGANFVRTVPHGLPPDLLPFSDRAHGGYLAFLGRISPEKGPEAAIAIAERAGLPLRMAAKVDEADRDYWNGVVEPLVRTKPHVEFVGEIDEREKASFLGHALALLVPVDWPEPFGLVMIEAMSCGTPVIAFRRGSIPEIVEHGRSGFVVDTVGGGVEAVGWLDSLSREEVRRAFEERFTAARMAADYLDVYRGLARVRLDAAHLRRASGGHRSLEVVA
ncbi:glycosyltransferase family 4 protein [Salinarimonas rosea]|uniref:glycosyltransferase family 4 protein n=1 Tax=Salinarimonas rosea TaxID=552063 RepID=UPI000401C873|nr:glycosyltransferase family 4 protein [Salinarimonas rosea]